MPKLTHEQLLSRLVFDYAVASNMQNRLVQIEAYPDPRSTERRANPIHEPADAARATHYRVEYRIKSLIAEGRYHDLFVISMDLLAGGNYPFSQPACFVISKPVPWSPHFLEGHAICLGELWTDLGGHGTVGHLILHIAKLLNFDEPDRESSYGGWRPEAVRYWRTVLHGRPITPGLAYPVLPVELMHGKPASGLAFKRIAEVSLAPAVAMPPAGVPAKASPTIAPFFRPTQR